MEYIFLPRKFNDVKHDNLYRKVGVRMAQSELMQMAELAMKKHKAVVSNWREGRIKKVWQDEDGNLCVMYNSGNWWQYNNLDKPVPEWW